MGYQIIKSPTQGTIDILCRRKGSDTSKTMDYPDTTGLIQGRIIEVIYAADMAEKAVGVTVEDVQDSYPQNMILLIVFGDTASMKAALDEMHKKEKEGKKRW